MAEIQEGGWLKLLGVFEMNKKLPQGVKSEHLDLEGFYIE
jgi:hypothetical protein